MSVIVLLSEHNRGIMVELILSMFHNGVKKIISKFPIVAEDKKHVKSEREMIFDDS